jgi:hypothetical protein
MQEKNIDVKIDSIKLCYDHFDNVRSPILKDQKNIFNVFYENDLKYRQINKFIALMEKNHGKEVDSLRKTDYEKYLKEFKKRIREVRLEVQEKERFDLMLHQGNRYMQTVDFNVWFTLFFIENTPIKIACTIFQFTVQYYEEKKMVPKTSIQIDLTKSFNQLTDNEIKLVESLSYSESPLNKADIERALEILEPFKAKYKYEPDFELMDKLRGVDSVSTTAKNNHVEENETKKKTPRIATIVWLEVAEEINKVDKFLPDLEGLSSDNKLRGRAAAINSKFGTSLNEGTIKNWDSKLPTKKHEKKIIELLNQYHYSMLAKAYSITNRN